MKSVDLNSNWRVSADGEPYDTDLPHDVTANAARDYSCAFGECNGYIPAARAVFTRALPMIKDGFVVLEIAGVCGYGSAFVNGEKIGTLNSYAPVYFALGNIGAHAELRLELCSMPGMSDKYVGLGIAGGVKLVVSEALDIDYGSLFVKTATVEGRTYADAEFTVFNNTEQTQKLAVECVAFNARGKRAGKKQKKLVLRAGSSKTVSVRVRINNPYQWSPSDPYTYEMVARLLFEDGTVSDCSTRFGIVTRNLSPTRGLYINSNNTLLFGAYVSHADAALGGVSLYCNEKRRLTALKNIGYNAVHFVECPTQAALDACDDVGMYAFVDLFSHLVTGKAPLDDIFTDYTVGEKVRALRNHPSVVMYGVADDVPECYDRNGGHELIGAIADEIRHYDGTRPITVSTGEQVPTADELEAAGIKKLKYDTDAAAKSAARERNLFDALTEGAFRSVDVCGFNYLYPLYDTEKLKRDRLIVGARTSSERAFESMDATEKNSRVIGDFNDCGIDYPGGGKLNEILTATGDIDAVCSEKPQSVYKRILLNERNVAYITAIDPDSGERVNMWNWPRYLGQKITVNVLTSGDVVALYFDGRLVGRRLAGKVNKHVAAFEVEYYPGTLEAVAYFKGVECARTTLKTAGSPKAIKLNAFEKSLYLSRGDLGFVTIDVCDRDGELVPYAMRELCASVTGGTLVAFINADPMLRKNAFDRCPAYNGRALAVVKPDPEEAKTVVKITGDGLLSSKISFKIKD